MNLMQQFAKELVELASNPKVATGVVAGTTSTGVGTWLYWIPNDIGKLASLVGIILSIVLIAVHVTVFRKHAIELEILKEEQKSRRKTDLIKQD